MSILKIDEMVFYQMTQKGKKGLCDYSVDYFLHSKHNKAHSYLHSLPNISCTSHPIVLFKISRFYRKSFRTSPGLYIVQTQTCWSIYKEHRICTHLTKVQWPFKVKPLWKIKGFSEVMMGKIVWPWQVIVSRSNKPALRFRISDFIRRSVSRPQKRGLLRKFKYIIKTDYFFADLLFGA